MLIVHPSAFHSATSWVLPRPQTPHAQLPRNRHRTRHLSVHAVSDRGWRKVADYLRRVPEDGLGLSLFYPSTGLPPHGQYLTEAEQTCDPMERKCTTPISVWEDDCRACSATGMARLRPRGRGSQRAMLGVCVACHGIGVVRRASARLTPTEVPNQEGSPYLAVVREQMATGKHAAGLAESHTGGAPARKGFGLPSLGELKAKAARSKQAGQSDDQGGAAADGPVIGTGSNGVAQLPHVPSNGKNTPPPQLQRLPSFGTVSGHEAPSNTAIRLQNDDNGAKKVARDPAMR